MTAETILPIVLELSTKEQKRLVSLLSSAKYNKKLKKKTNSWFEKEVRQKLSKTIFKPQNTP